MASRLDALARLLAPETLLRRLLAFVVTCIACAALLTDFSLGGAEDLREGDVAPHDVIAPLAFPFVNVGATAERQRLAESQVPPVFDADLTLSKRIENRVSQAFDMARRRWEAATVAGTRGSAPPVPAETASILADFTTALELPIEPADVEAIAAVGFSKQIEEVTVELLGVAMRRNIIQDRTSLPDPQRPITVVNLFGDVREESTLEDYSLIRTPDEARQAVTLHVLERYGSAREPAAIGAAAAIARAAVRTTFGPNAELTEERKAAARAAVGAVEVEVRRGTRIVAAGDVLTAPQEQMLGAMRRANAQAGGIGGFVGWFAFVAVVIGVTLAFAQSTIRKFASRTRDREALAFALLLVLAFGRLLSSTAALITLPTMLAPDLLALLVPVAGGAMLVRILVNSESALIWALVASLLSGVLMDASPLLMAWYVVTALIATTAVGPARERLVVLRAGLWCGLGGALFVLVVGALRAQDPGGDDPFTFTAAVLAFVTALAAGLLNAVLALGMVPAFELFGFVTDYKLLELASLNHPLLRQLMLRAPGTYHHSVIVGTLSEAACETIGANALLARVACYFHDIGKGLKPQYFIENQRDTGNRHDRLSPEASAAVIINHVREGGVLALQHQLPRPIVDNIYMHHGTGLIQYFYARAKENAGADEVVDERLFRYPGPKPDSREAGIIMLADKVEAACRTIREPNEERIRAMIQQIVNGVMTDGQLENCPLTLRELYQIADTFTTVLLGIYHHRIEYPATKEISSGKGRFVPIPKQGTITLEIMNPLKSPPPLGSSGLPASPTADDAPLPRRVDES
ncbi:MAG: HDIG domain-containing protein [Pseudomonadota bacterium]|nr:HDIG domain-containing protein [Pseudomonadota bacterium]